MKELFEKFKMRDKGTIVRTILLFLSVANYVVSIICENYAQSSPIWTWVSFGIFLVMTLISYWYNNNWTGFASIAEDVFNMLSDGKITAEEMTAFIAKHKTTTTEEVKKITDSTNTTTTEGDTESK